MYHRVTVAENDRNACQGAIPPGVNGEIFVLEASVASPAVIRRKLPDPSGDLLSWLG